MSVDVLVWRTPSWMWRVRTRRGTVRVSTATADLRRAASTLAHHLLSVGVDPSSPHGVELRSARGLSATDLSAFRDELLCAARSLARQFTVFQTADLSVAPGGHVRITLLNGFGDVLASLPEYTSPLDATANVHEDIESAGLINNRAVAWDVTGTGTLSNDRRWLELQLELHLLDGQG